VQATVLASHLLDALENHQDAAMVLLPYDYSDEVSCIVAEGLGFEQTIVAKGLGV
jgi:hypothetical protein